MPNHLLLHYEKPAISSANTEDIASPLAPLTLQFCIKKYVTFRPLPMDRMLEVTRTNPSWTSEEELLSRFVVKR